MKITLPGPMTIADTVVDQHYNNNKVLGRVLSKILNKEIKDLVSAGCKYIQVSTVPRRDSHLKRTWELVTFPLLKTLNSDTKHFHLDNFLTPKSCDEHPGPFYMGVTPPPSPGTGKLSLALWALVADSSLDLSGQFMSCKFLWVVVNEGWKT